MAPQQRFACLVFSLLIPSTGVGVPGPQEVSGEPLPVGLGEAVREALAETSYEVLWQVGTPLPGIAAAWQAPNRGQGMRTFFTDAGVQVVPRTAAGGGWRLGLRTEALGREGRTAAVPDAAPTVDGCRVEYRRGALVEWYENGPLGLEQGFTVEAESAGPASSTELEIRIAVDGDWDGRLAPGGGAIAFTAREEAVTLRYEKLRAWDAKGTALPALMDWAEGRIVLRVEATEARYPVTIDPLLVVEQAQLLAVGPPAPGEDLGTSVAIDGDLAVVGAPGNDAAGIDAGAVYVFSRESGSWSAGTRLVASDAFAGGLFGRSVSVSGTTIAVGAVDRLYAFELVGESWTQSFHTVGSPGIGYGAAVAVSGEWLLVGAPQYEPCQWQCGISAFFDMYRGLTEFYRYDGSNWSFFQATYGYSCAGEPLDPPLTAYGGAHGKSLAVDGEWAIVGAPWGLGDEPFYKNWEWGSCDIYHFDGVSWVLERRVLEPVFPLWCTQGERTGDEVDIDFDGAVVTAVATTDFEGDVRVERLAGSVWSSTSFSGSGPCFGTSAAVEGDAILLGASCDAGGSLYVYERTGPSWSQTQKLVQDGSATGLGTSVGMSGDTAVVGAVHSPTGVSAAVVFERAPGSWFQDEYLATGGAALDYFGWSLSLSGDVALVGAHYRDDSGLSAGAAYAFRRVGEQWHPSARLFPSDPAAGDVFGFSVAVDGDHAVVGAHFDDDLGADSGSAYLFERTGPDTWQQTHKLTASDGAAGDHFGRSVAIDATGGRALVGAPNHDAARGGAYVFHLDDGSEEDDLTDVVLAPGDHAGASVSLEGINGYLGAPDALGGQGRVFRFRKIILSTDWELVETVAAPDGAAGDLFGRAVSIAGTDLFVGAPGDSDGAFHAGSTYVFSWDDQTDSFLYGQELLAGDAAAGDAFGTSVAAGGGRALIGAPLADQAGADSGSAYLFEDLGTWTPAGEVLPSGLAAGDGYGRSVAVDGSHLAVGANLTDAPLADAGAAYVFDAPFHTELCFAKTSSGGCSPSIDATGMPTLTGDDDFHVTAAGVPGQTTGILLWSLEPNPVFPGGSMGAYGNQPWGTRYCVLRPQAVGSQGSGGTSAACDGTFSFHFSQAVLTGAGLTAGETVYAQWSYSDRAHPDGSGLGHTAAIAFEILP